MENINPCSDNIVKQPFYMDFDRFIIISNIVRSNINTIDEKNTFNFNTVVEILTGCRISNSIRKKMEEGFIKILEVSNLEFVIEKDLHLVEFGNIWGKSSAMTDIISFEKKFLIQMMSYCLDFFDNNYTELY